MDLQGRWPIIIHWKRVNKCINVNVRGFLSSQCIYGGSPGQPHCSAILFLSPGEICNKEPSIKKHIKYVFCLSFFSPFLKSFVSVFHFFLPAKKKRRRNNHESSPALHTHGILFWNLKSWHKHTHTHTRLNWKLSEHLCFTRQLLLENTPLLPRLHTSQNIGSPVSERTSYSSPPLNKCLTSLNPLFHFHGCCADSPIR